MSSPRPNARPNGAAVLAALGAGFTLHLLLAGRVPGGIDVDTASEALRGLRLVVLKRFEVLTFSNGPSCETLYLYLCGLTTKLLGGRPMALVLPAAATATLVVLLLVLLVRRLAPEVPWGVPVALATGSIWLFHYGQVGLRAISAPAFLLGTALVLGWSEGRELRHVRHLIAGGLIGLSVYAYSACRLLPLAWAIHALIRWLRSRRDPVVLRQSLVTAAGIFFVSVPNLLFLVDYPMLFLDRGYYVYKGGVGDKLANVASTFLLPFHYPDRYRVGFGEAHAFDGSGVELTSIGIDPVEPFLLVLMLAGAIPLSRLAKRVEVSYLLVSLVVCDLFLGISGPSLTRLLIVLPVYLLAATLGLAALWRAGLPRWAVASALSLFLLAQGWRYVVVFGGSPFAQHHPNPSVNAMGARARDLADSGKRVLLVTADSRSTVRFYCWREIERIWLVEGARPVDPARVPLAGFAPHVILVQHRPEFRGFVRSLRRASTAPEGAPYDELPTPELAASLRGDPLPGNLRKLWSDIRF